jgi:hypothetical protein
MKFLITVHFSFDKKKQYFLNGEIPFSYLLQLISKSTKEKFYLMYDKDNIVKDADFIKDLKYPDVYLRFFSKTLI